MQKLIINPSVNTLLASPRSTSPQRDETPIRILVVDDEIQLCEVLKRGLQKLSKNYTIHTAHSGDAAWELIQREQFDVMITDLRLPGIDGLELLKRVLSLQL